MSSISRVYAGERMRRGASLPALRTPPDPAQVRAAPIRPPIAPTADVNVKNPKEYWDYENFNITWG
jgi:hypothetical protein